MIDNLSFLVIAPEILLLVMACVIALVDLGVKSRLRDATYWLTMATLAMGVYPKPVTDVMHVSVTELLKHVAVSKLP